MGNTTVLTPEVIRKIAEAIYPAGNFFGPACVLAGIAESTGYNWMAMAEHRKRRSPGVPEELLMELMRQVRYSEAQLENAGVVQWRSKFPEDWRALEAFMSRRFPERWKETKRQEVTGAEGGPLEIRFIDTDDTHD